MNQLETFDKFLCSALAFVYFGVYINYYRIAFEVIWNCKLYGGHLLWIMHFHLFHY